MFRSRLQPVLFEFIDINKQRVMNSVVHQT